MPKFSSDLPKWKANMVAPTDNLPKSSENLPRSPNDLVKSGQKRAEIRRSAENGRKIVGAGLAKAALSLPGRLAIDKEEQIPSRWASILWGDRLCRCRGDRLSATPPMSIFKNRLTVTIVAALLSLSAQQSSFAGSATWSSNPVSNEWTNAQNWMPNTVPNGAADIANFGASNVKDLELTGLLGTAGINFNSDASSYSIIVKAGSTLGTVLSITEAGITNASGKVQTFSTENNDPFGAGIFFFNDATAGEMTSFVGVGGYFSFHDSSSAGSASFDISVSGSFAGEVVFFDNSTAEDAIIALSTRGAATFVDTATAAKATITAVTGGDVIFGTASSAGNALITVSGDSTASFTASATADHCQITAQAAASSSEGGAEISVGDNATAGEATFVLEGGSVTGAGGTVMTFFNEGTAGKADITVHGGTNGGKGALVLFQAKSDGGTASFSLFGDGKVDFSKHAPGLVTVGSVEGDGQVVLGATALAVGSNNQSTTFSGVIEDGPTSGGSISKIGSGALRLSNANTYTGGTTVSAGALLIKNETGSGTGTGPVAVNGGSLAGSGVVAGAVTIGSGNGAGALLAPGQGTARASTLTIESSLTFKSDATYRSRLNARKRRSDQVVANGVTIESGAQFSFEAVGGGRLRPGKVATVISNTAATPIAGTFANLPDGSTISAGVNTLQVSYHGGDGNDLTLTVVP